MVAPVEAGPVPGALAELMRSRRSIRAFRDEPLDRRLVAALLQEAMWSPSPHNSQPWRFTVLAEPDDKQRLAAAMAERLSAELRADDLDEADIDRQTQRSVRRISTAPVVVLCSLHPDGLAHSPDARRASLEWQMAVQSVGTVLQSLFLL